MSSASFKEIGKAVKAAKSSDMGTQIAALCYRVERGKPRILLVTSRGTGRWIPPKGWPMAGREGAEVAAREAWEEAGVVGEARDVCLGVYTYVKLLADGTELPCIGLVYPVEVETLARRFPERGQRRRKWFSPAKAAGKVDEPELAQILRDFDPGDLA